MSSSDSIIQQIEFPEKLSRLFEPARYKVLYGGRGGMKSHAIARALLILGIQRPLRILCARELQKSIKDSVHRLLKDLIESLGLSSFYHVQLASITGANGTEFFFEGLRHNVSQIKSYEGADICWVEEAATVSKSSWDYLIPTIRKEGSEIWISFNPELEEDETYQRFVVNPPVGAVVIKTSWADNRWLTDVLRLEMAACRERSEADYQVIWEGHCRQAVEGAIYANEMRDAAAGGRIVGVPYDKRHPVCTFWDLGYADCTSIWFIQKVGLEYHVINFYQNSHYGIAHYIEVLKSKNYIYSTDYLPWDGRAKQLGSGLSIEEMLQSNGRRVDIAPRLDIVDGINAVRTIFNALWFDKAKCADGLQALRRYHYAINPDTNRVGNLPLHDTNSHAADALRTFATTYNVMWDAYVERAPWQVQGQGKAVCEYDPFNEVRV